jgi:hypothetical protein|nr:MAG TPA: hypothetical protein [Caudoviricetes sp.]
MDYPINAKVIEIIDKYMKAGEPLDLGTERFCMGTFKDMCEKVFREKCVTRLVYRKIDEPRFTSWDIKYGTYFQGNTWCPFSWFNGRRGFGYRYFLKASCELYFEKHARQIISLFFSERHTSIEDAILETDCFLELWNVFEKWFDERRNKFMENMKTDIQEIRSMSTRKTPQSHGGVANLLKALTKTMEKQGSDITSIAKVQYAICIQAGIYIPDEFIRDVAVTLDMPINDAEREGVECQE